WTVHIVVQAAVHESGAGGQRNQAGAFAHKVVSNRNAGAAGGQAQPRSAGPAKDQVVVNGDLLASGAEHSVVEVFACRREHHVIKEERIAESSRGVDERGGVHSRVAAEIIVVNLHITESRSVQRVQVNAVVVKGVAGGVPIGEIAAAVVVNARREQCVSCAIGCDGHAVIGVVGVQPVHLHAVIRAAHGNGEAAAGVAAAHVVHRDTGAGDREAVGPDIVRGERVHVDVTQGQVLEFAMISRPPVERGMPVLVAESAAVIGFLYRAVAAAIQYQIAPAAEQYAGAAAAGGQAQFGVEFPFQSDRLSAHPAAAKGQVIIGGAIE